MTSPFIAVDGEATEGDYTLLAATGLPPLVDLSAKGLKTVACLEYLLRIAKPSIAVCFGVGYDTNMWLRDLPRTALQRLWTHQVCHWGKYRLEWVPRCWFRVSHVDGRSTTVHEVWGFFQSSFVKALDSWAIGAPEEMERMKAERGTFTRDDIAEVTTYCLSELDYLVSLMDSLRTACRESGIVPRKWFGAGQMASALLDSRNVKAHHVHDIDLAKGSHHVAESMIQGAYFGGRVELLHQGVHWNVTAADLKSAYPAAMQHLPSLHGARLHKVSNFNPDRPGIWKVSWRCPPTTQIAPFPVRVKMSIYYPAEGEGVYHTAEVAAAIELGYPVKVHHGYVLRGPGVELRPFAWVPDVFAARARFVAEGRAAEKAVKLALNSTYGKLAQGPSLFIPTPKFQSYFWAGQITAVTRAAVLRAAASAREPIMIATDGIFAKEFDPTVLGPDTGKLGSWETEPVSKMFAAQPGVYQTTDSTGAIRSKSRGFFAREVDYDALEEAWDSEGCAANFTYSSTRFQGLGSSLARVEFGVWREWTESRRTISLWPERKIATPGGRLLPWPGMLKSEPYRSKLTLADAKALAELGDESELAMRMEDLEYADQPRML